ncbi:hypothetical protein AB8B02_14310 [Tardiphaga sp. 862_B3_N4_1]|uniref:hypothetical protein n=1 Tax=Tardiphaga sp. 862_B3_N4_1 TaxID=3240764 RepID=UPI003F263C60
MKALTFRGTSCPVKNWEKIAASQSRGYAYEKDGHFIQMYGVDNQLWVISPGLTIAERASGTLQYWVEGKFGAREVQPTKNDVGVCVEGIWRPGLFFDVDVKSGLAQSEAELRLAEQQLLLLLQRLDEILLFIEPTDKSLEAFGSKTRELLLLACTSVEAQWRYYLVKAGITAAGQGFNTKDYVCLRDVLYLSEYEVSLPRHGTISPIRPFLDWDSAKPTKSLAWYDAYNTAKHDGLESLSAATLQACIAAVAANIVLFSVRFGPYRLYNGGGMLSSVFNSHFQVGLVDCDVTTFYVPDLDLPQFQGMMWGQLGTIPPKPQKLVL